VSSPLSKEIKLRPYQEKCVYEIRDQFGLRLRSVLLVLPTGAGKTYTFSYIANEAQKKNGYVLILAHRKELVMQASLSLASLGVEHSVIAPGNVIAEIKVQHVRELGACYVKQGAHVSVGSIQTVVRRLPSLQYPTLLIPDEAHHCVSTDWRKVLNYFPRARILGVTATPIRTDGQGLGTHVGGVFDAMVLGPTMRELIALGNLVTPKIYMPGTEIDLKGVRVTASGDYNSEQLNDRIKTARPTIIGDAVEWYRKLANGKRAVAFCASVGAAQATAKAFCDAGYKFVSLDGTMDNTERRRAVLMLNAGEIDGITSCDIVSEGFDCPGLEVAILLRPTHSEGLYLQQVGRVLRPANGKSFGIIIDHVGNVANFGPPHWDREWSLDGGIEKRKSSASQEEQVLIRTCPKCFSVHDPAPRCPECGHIYVIKARKLEQKDGELIELTPEMEAKMAMQKGKAKQQGRAQTIESLIRLAMTRGNDPAWAYHIFMSRDGNTAHDVKAGVERLLGEMRGEIEANPLGSGELRANMTKIHQAYSYRLGKVGVALAPM